MTTEIAADILRDQQFMESQRMNFDTMNQRIAELIWPASALFTQQTNVPGQRRDQSTFDSTASLALPRFAAAAESILIPRTQKYQSLSAGDNDLDRIPAVRAYCEKWTDILFKARYAPRAGFTYASGEGLQSLGAFGEMCIFTDEDIGRDLRYRYMFYGSIWHDVDHAGRVDKVHRKFMLTARQAMQKFNKAVDQLPKEIKDAAEKRPNQEFEFIHCVKPRQDYDPNRRDFRGMRQSSYYLATCREHVIEEGGYRKMPYTCSRFSTAPGETYGRGPAASVLNVLNLVNEQAKTLLRAGQRAVDPPIMMVDDDALETFNLKAGALNRGFIGADGTALAVPFNQNANLPFGIEMVQDSRQVINEGFFNNLFRILIEEPQRTATEALLRAQEKGELLGPTVGRQQQEFLDPLTDRELDLLSQVTGLGPEMPPELEEAGGFMAIKYDSPLNRMQRSGEASGMLQWMEMMTPVEQLVPGTIKSIVSIPRFGRELATIQGVPQTVLLNEDEQGEEADAAAQQEQAAMMMQAAPIAGKTALDLARAQQLASAQPSAATLL